MKLLNKIIQENIAHGVQNRKQKRCANHRVQNKMTERIRMAVIITDINELNISLEEKASE